MADQYIGYAQFGGPGRTMQTVSARVRYRNGWQALVHGRWRKIHVTKSYRSGRPPEELESYHVITKCCHDTYVEHVPLIISAVDTIPPVSVKLPATSR